MRKIIVMSMITLDGVMQSPGGPTEDPANGFKYGGWVAPFDGDEADEKLMGKLMAPSELLLGRKTYDIWAAYWPQHGDYWPGINDVRKYVLSGTLQTSDWNNTVFLDSLEAIATLKNSPGSDLKVWGSSELVQLLLQRDLVDELWLKIYPLLLGPGKKLFDNVSLPAAYTLVESLVTRNGVFIGNYKRAGEVKTGTVGV